MSNTAKGLIAGIAAVVLLGGGIAAMKLTEPKNENDSSSSLEENQNLSIYSGSADDIESVEVLNSNGGYTLTRTHKAEKKNEETTAAQTTAVTDDSKTSDVNTYTIKELENVKLDSSLIDNIPTNAATLTAQRIIDENPTDLSKFGLDSPKATVTVKFDGSDAKTVKLLVGNDTPAGDIYVKLGDSNTVYSVSSSFIKAYTYEKEYFVSLICVEKPADEDTPIVSSVVVDRADLDYDIELDYDPLSGGNSESGGTTATHVMSSPVNAYLNVSDSVKYTHGIFGLKASSVLSISPSEQELEFAGITNPLCTVTTTLEDGTRYVLKIGVKYGADGDSEKTRYIGYLEGTDVLWLFDSSSVPWVEMKPEDAMSSMVFGSYIYDVSGITINTADSALSFKCTGDSADNFKVSLDGKDFDFERFKSFYQALIKAPAEEICLTEDGIGDRLASVTITKTDGSPAENIEFYQAENNKVIIKKDGKVCFKCRASYVQKSLLPNIENVNGDSDFVTNW